MRLYVYKDTEAGATVLLLPGVSAHLPPVIIRGKRSAEYWEEVAAAIAMASEAAKPKLVQVRF